MNARITLSNDTAHQMSSYGMILDWMQKNPGRCNNTNITSIARSVVLSGYKTTESAVWQALNKMIKNQMIYRTNGIRRGNFRINYLHKQIPGYIIDSAPQPAKDYRNKTINGIKPGQYIDKVGCVVTPAEKKEQEEEPKEVTITKAETPAKVSQEETKEVSSDASEENTVSVPVQVTDTEHGLSISITLNINLNK